MDRFVHKLILDDDYWDDDDLDDLDFSDQSQICKLLSIPPPTPPKDVRKEAKERSAKIHERYHLLQHIVVRHEPTIQKRWPKKSKQQKLKILLGAWPGMPAKHRPDFDAFRKESEQQRRAGTRYRQEFMWPYINQEDLVKPKNLLWLINSRARHHPSLFAAADMEATHLGCVTKAIVPIFLNEHVMVLNGATDAKSYGELIAWEDHPEAFNWMHTRKQYLPGEGLLVLKLQERLFGFLVDCCHAILHDIPTDQLTSNVFPILPEPSLKTEAETSGFESQAVMAAEAPYRLPALVDFGAIESLLEAKASAARDRIWALREDPGYFAEAIADIKEHRLEILKDSDGKMHPVFATARGSSIFWARITCTLVVQNYMDFEVYSELHRQAHHLQSLHNKYAATISPAKELPDEFLAAILRFQHYLNEAAKAPMFRLRTNVPSSPPMRKFFARVTPPDAITSHIHTVSKRGIKLTNIERQLMWLLITLWDNSTDLFFAGMPLVLDELERLVEADSHVAELLSPRVMDHIGDLAIISECLNQIKRYQPWARGYTAALVDRIDGIEKDYSQWDKRLESLNEGLKAGNMESVGQLADVSDRRFFYPTEKRRNQQTVEALRKAEQNLDEFWAAVDKVVYRQWEYLAGSAVGAALLEERVLQRTPEWVDDGRRDGKKKQGSAPVDQPESIFKPLSTLSFNLGPGAQLDKAELGKKTRIKTKGVAMDEAPIASPSKDHEPPKPAQDPIRLHVDSRALKVFRALFFNPNVTSSPGEIAWHDFVHAMTSTGLFTAEKLYGSVWQFQRLDGESQCKIQFHQPHPRGKIPFTTARRMGRRLTRAFGWAGDLFELRSNEAS
ncbi:hypothetical protein QBC47DRAFT_184957 [Echria macrotheca]|uniref:Uncharacterized protein n=1 Tax=Echria macrotheca TaxID=438768 RepID=A0AAJ0BDP1_9PEZI|nr:hypothetical protein QBC47DRAFT_184957 [Echria macrotheca]